MVPIQNDTGFVPDYCSQGLLVEIHRLVRCCSNAETNWLGRSWVVKLDILIHQIWISMHEVLIDFKIANRKSCVSFDMKSCIPIHKWKVDKKAHC